MCIRDSANASANLGRLLVDQSRFIEAEACYRDALKTQPENAEILERPGGVLVELGRLQEMCIRDSSMGGHPSR